MPAHQLKLAVGLPRLLRAHRAVLYCGILLILHWLRVADSRRRQQKKLLAPAVKARASFACLAVFTE